MQISDLTGATLSAVFGRIVRRMIAVALVVFFAVIALYYLTTAGLVALQANYGVLYAYLIVGACYVVAAAVPLVGLVVTRSKASLVAPAGAGQLSPRNMQIAMLIEAVMLGYMVAAKTGHRRDR